jgi:hypothetical protein
MKTQISTAALAAALLLAGCGGGGGGGGGGVSSTPNPPSPPAPAPPPPPPPPPTQANDDLVAPLATESFTNDAVTGRADFPAGGNGSSSAERTTLSVVYDAATGNYTVSGNGREQAFRPGDRSAAQSNAEMDVYLRTSGNSTDSLSLSRASIDPGTRSSPQYRYVGGGVWQRTVQSGGSVNGTADIFTYGVETPDASLVRTGSGTYPVQLRGIGAFNDTVGATRGSGNVSVDFGSGALTGNGTIFTIAPNGNREGDRPWRMTAALSSNANRFAGSFGMGLPFGFTPLDMSGAIDGRFYGPAAEELGASWYWRDSFLGTTFAGYMLGKDARLFPQNQGLANLIVDEDLAEIGFVYRLRLDTTTGTPQLGGLPNPNPFSVADIRYSETARAYLINYQFSFVNQVIDPATRNAALSNASFDVYTFTNQQPGQPVQTYEVRFFRPGPTNPTMNLSYASFAYWNYRLPDTLIPYYHNYDEGYFAFGLATPAPGVPASGTGTYDAAVFGQSVYERNGDTNYQPYNIGGDARLIFNFGSGTLAGYMHPIATDRTSGTRFDLGRYDFTATNYAVGSTTYSGIFARPFTNLPNEFNGRFMGPGAQELIGRFQTVFTHPVTGQESRMFGIWVGRDPAR